MSRKKHRLIENDYICDDRVDLEELEAKIDAMTEEEKQAFIFQYGTDNDKYEIICEKLGFDFLNYLLEKDFKEDSGVDPFAVLSEEELQFALDFSTNNK